MIIKILTVGLMTVMTTAALAASSRVERGVRVHYGEVQASEAPVAQTDPQERTFPYQVRIDPGYRGTDLYVPNASDYVRPEGRMQLEPGQPDWYALRDGRPWRYECGRHC